jgi:flagellar motor protein MotB
MTRNLLLSASAIALLLSGVASGPGALPIAWAQSEQDTVESGEQPPIPLEKLRKRDRRKNQQAESAEGEEDAEQQPRENRAGSREERRRERAERAEGEEDAEQQTESTESSEEVAEPVEQQAESAEGEDDAEQQPRENRAGSREERRRERAEERDERRRERDERREAERGQQENTTGEAARSEQANEEQESEPTVSSDAETPKAVAKESVEEQVKQAEQEPTAVVPDEITGEQRQRLKAAERKRREDARRDRGRLLGAAAVGAAIGALVPSLGGTVAADEGDRIVVRRDGRLIVRKDESALFRNRESDIRYERMRNGLTREIVTRPNGVQIISVKDEGGNVLRRIRVGRNGERTVLFNSRDDDVRRNRPPRDLPRYRVDIPRDRYVVSGRRGDRRLFRETFMAEPVYDSPQRYSLQEIRDNEEVRGLMRRVDLDTVTFETGSAFVSESQVRLLGDIAGSMLDVIDERPDTVFLIEGHTDLVGGDVQNLTLSDRRAESVARILVEAYGIPPENLVTQGYGEQYPKVPTEFAERENRRATVRNITPILEAYAEEE